MLQVFHNGVVVRMVWLGCGVWRGGSSGLCGMTGMWKGEMIDGQKAEFTEGLCYEEVTPTQQLCLRR